MAERRLKYILEAESKVGGAFDDLNQRQKDAASEAKKSSEEIARSYEAGLGRIAAASAVAFAATTASIGFAVKGAMADEVALTRLRGAIKNTGDSWDQYSDEIERAVSLAMDRGFADDQSVAALSRMVDMTGNAQEALDTFSMAQDLAVSREIDLATAGDAVAKAKEGVVGILGRLIPGLQEEIAALGENATAADRAALMMEKLSKYQGRAAEVADTASGAIKTLNLRMGDLSDAIGAAFLPAVGNLAKRIRPVVLGLTEWAGEHPELIKYLGLGTIAVTGFLTAVTGLAIILPKVSAGMAHVRKVGSVLTGLVTFQTTALWGNTLAWNALGLAILAAPGWGWALAGVAAIAALTIAFTDWGDGIRTAKDELKELTELMSATADATGVFADNLADVGAAMDAVIPQLNQTTEEKKKVAGATRDLTAVLKEYGFETLPNVLKKQADLILLMQHTDVVVRSQAAKAFAELTDSMGRYITEAQGLKSIVPSLAEMLPTRELPPLVMSVNLDAKTSAVFRSQHEELLAEASYAANAANEQDAADYQLLWEQKRVIVEQNLAAITAGYRTAVDTMFDAEMTGKKRREAIWNSMRTTFVRQIAEQVRAFVVGEMVKQQAAGATEKVQAASSAAFAKEIGSLIASIGKWLALIAAKIYAWYASLGPWAIPAAAATIAGVIAAVRAIHFQEGGIVGGSGRGDRVPAMLEPGEYVMRREVTERNLPMLEALNAGRSAGNTYHLTVNADNRLGVDDFLEIRRLMREMLPSAIEDLVSRRRMTLPGFAL